MSKPEGSPVIVALDVSSRNEALALVECCREHAAMFKVGSQLFVAEGPEIVRAIVGQDRRVFLDLKFHDIPNTVALAALESARLGVSMLTIHAGGGPEMVRATREKLEAECGPRRPIVVAVTVLTSMDRASLAATGIAGAPAEQVVRLARMAVDAGADGVVCSPEEVRMVRQALGPAPRIVTPGVRMPGQSADDQKRVATPRRAVSDGASWIVVGRYVNRAHDPGAAIREVLATLELSGYPSGAGS